MLAKQATAVSPLATGSVIEPANVADLLGYGTSNTFETQAAAAPAGNTDVKSLNRSNGADSNNNAADFALNATITPKAAGGTVDPDPVDPDPVDPPACPRQPRPSPKSRAPVRPARSSAPPSPPGARSPRRSPPAVSPATTSRPRAPAAT